MPPSQIIETWSIDELRDAECLASIEGWGQDWLRCGAIQAEIHNAMRQSLWAQSKPGTRPPKLLTADDFMPKRMTERQVVEQEKNQVRKLRSVMNSLCGF